jgi:hypothetical protein
VTICCAFVTPADAAPDDEDDELAAGDELAAVELLELLELQPASTAAAVSTAPGASQRFHLCVIA